MPCTPCNRALRTWSSAPSGSHGPRHNTPKLRPNTPPTHTPRARTTNRTTRYSQQLAAISHQPSATQRKMPASSQQPSAKKPKSATSASSYEPSTNNQTMHSATLGPETSELFNLHNNYQTLMMWKADGPKARRASGMREATSTLQDGGTREAKHANIFNHV